MPIHHRCTHSPACPLVTDPADPRLGTYAPYGMSEFMPVVRECEVRLGTKPADKQAEIDGLMDTLATALAAKRAQEPPVTDR